MGLMEWIFGNRPPIPPEVHGHNGIYRIYGDPRPLLPKLKTLKERVDEGKEPPDEYFKLLDKVFYIVCKPLGPEYEAKVLSEEYKNFVKVYKEKNLYTFEYFAQKKHKMLIAIVKVLRPNMRLDDTCKVAPIQVFRGTLPQDGILGVPTVCGFEYGWFIKGETCLVICVCPDPKNFESGPIPFSDQPIVENAFGRLPFTKSGKYLISFAPNEDYWKNFPSYFKNGMHFVEWAPVKEFLLKIQNSIKSQ